MDLQPHSRYYQRRSTISLHTHLNLTWYLYWLLIIGCLSNPFTTATFSYIPLLRLLKAVTFCTQNFIGSASWHQLFCFIWHFCLVCPERFELSTPWLKVTCSRPAELRAHINFGVEGGTRTHKRFSAVAYSQRLIPTKQRPIKIPFLYFNIYILYQNLTYLL